MVGSGGCALCGGGALRAESGFYFLQARQLLAPYCPTCRRPGGKLKRPERRVQMQKSQCQPMPAKERHY